MKNQNNISAPMKASFWFVVCSFAQKGIAFFTVPVFTRLLSTSSYGVTAIYSSWMEIISIFATFQLTTGVFNKAMIKYEHDRDGFTSSMLSLAFLSTATCFLIYFLFARFWNKLFQLPTYFVVLMFLEILISTVMAFWSIRNRFEYKYKSIVILTISASLFGPITSIFLLTNFPQGSQPLLKIIGIIVVKVMLYTPLIFIILKRGKKVYVGEYWRYALLYNLPLIPHYLSQQVLSQSDRIMINSICGNSAAGIYAIAYQLSMTLFIFVMAILNSYTPWCFENIKRRDCSQVRRISLMIEVAVGGACFFFSLFAPELIYLLGGKEYSAAVWIVPSVSMSVLFQTIYSFFADVEFYFEKTKIVMYASISVSLLNLGLNAIFIPKFGFVAAGYTTLFCYMVYSFVHYIFMKKICKDNQITDIYNGKLMWIVAVICVIFSLISNVLYKNYILRYSVIFVGTIIIGAIVFLKRKQIIDYIKKKY